MKTQTKLNVFCPHCNKSLISEEKNGNFAVFNNSENNKIKVLAVYEDDTADFINDNIFCPYCKTKLSNEENIAKLTLVTNKNLANIELSTAGKAKWQGLTKADMIALTKKVKRQKMPEQDPIIRAHNFEEVPYGYTTELAKIEAERCIQCKNPKCVEGCPVGVKIPEFIKLIADEKYAQAAKKIKETNILPAVCGRVCPQEDQCEKNCVLGIKGEPVAIGNLERFAADFERKLNLVENPVITEKLNKSVAVVGSGPGGITVAADLAKYGYDVTMFEALHEPGGVLVYGIPEFRLPKSIVKFELDYLKKLGVKIELNKIIGKLYTVDELLEKFNAVFIAVGAGTPRFLGLPGESMKNIFSANEYLTRINLMKAYKFPEYDTPMPIGKKIAVVGAGNVAMDCARNAIRIGAEEVSIVYRRSRNELPAREEEIHHAEQEGVIFRLLTNPVKYIGDENGWIKGMECVKMELGEPDSSGRRRPVPIKDSNFELEFDMVIVAVGTDPNPIIFQTTPDLARNRWGNIEVNEETMETSKEFVYAGGDIVTGSATVIEAMGAGRKAAKAIHEKLSK